MVFTLECSGQSRFLFRHAPSTLPPHGTRFSLLRHEWTRVTSLNNHFRFVFAHRVLCAAAILARPSALIFLRGLAVAVVIDPNGRPRFAE